MSALEDDLDAYVVGDEPDQPDEPPPVPEDADGANRLLRRIRGLERLRDAHREIAYAELGRIQEWYEDRASGLTASIRFTERSLEEWMRAHHTATGGKVKTVKVPNGELRVRPGSTRLGVLDEPAAVAEVILAGRRDFVRTKDEIAKKDAGPWVFAGPQAADGPELAPDGFAWRAAWMVAGFDVAWAAPVPLLVPRLERLEQLAVLVPLWPVFGYSTAKRSDQEGK